MVYNIVMSRPGKKPFFQLGLERSAGDGETGILTLEVAEITCRTRGDFLQALRKGDAERSRTLITEQIEQGRRTVLAYLRERRRRNRNT